MVDEYGADLDRIFGALGDPTRRALIARLAGGRASVGQLAAPFDMSLQAVSKHLKVLERAGLVRRTVEGRTHQLELVARPMQAAASWLAFYRDFWGRRLDELEAHLAQHPDHPEHHSQGNDA